MAVSVRAALVLTACLLFPARAQAKEDGSSALSPAALPTADRVEPSQAAQPLRPTAESIPGPPPVTAGLMEPPNGTALDTWLDLPHAFVGRRIFDISNGFDRFFADERDLGSLRSRSFLRWRSEIRVAEDGTLAFGTGVRADISLPNLEKRLRAFRIVLENVGSGLAESEPRSITGQQGGGRGDAGVRWTLLDTLRSSIDVGGGVLFDIPPGLVARTRFRIARELGPVALARGSTTGFWNTRDGFGYNASLSFERPLGQRLLLRWTTGTLVSQRSTGYEGSSELALLAKLGSFSAITLLGSGSGLSKPEPVVKTWRVAARLRSTLFRRWIYGEVEPEVRWPLDAVGGRRPVPAVMFRLELQFEAQPPVAAPLRAGLASAGRKSTGDE